jgi:CheY-like chemotaxis protein
MPGKKQSKKIVIADDEPEIIDLLRQVITARGFTQVRDAPDGKKALDLIDADVPDLLILDMNMPTMNGYEVIARLKGSLHTRDIPVIILSGHYIDEQRISCGSIKNIFFIPKPFDNEALLTMVENILGK